jgi:predicted nucleic acid-binding protein
MKHIVIDTSIFIALYRDNDPNHLITRQAAQKIDKTTHTHHLNEYILAEILTVLFLKTKDIAKTQWLHNEISTNPRYQVHPITSELKSLTYNIFLSQKKPHLSITDASLIALCKTLKTKHLFTLDQTLIKAAKSHHLSPIKI